MHRGKQQPRCAVPALQSVAFRKCLLHRMQRAVLGKSLHRGNLAALRHRRKQSARLDRAPVQQHRARSAIRRVAPDVRPREIQVLPQKFHQQRARLDLRLPRLAVHPHLHHHFFSARHIRAPPPLVHPPRAAPLSRSPVSPAPPPASACTPPTPAYRSALRPPPAPLPLRAGCSSHLTFSPAVRSPHFWPGSPSIPRNPAPREFPCRCPCLPASTAPPRSRSHTPARFA